MTQPIMSLFRNLVDGTVLHFYDGTADGRPEWQLPGGIQATEPYVKVGPVALRLSDGEPFFQLDDMTIALLADCGAVAGISSRWHPIRRAVELKILRAMAADVLTVQDVYQLGRQLTRGGGKATKKPAQSYYYALRRLEVNDLIVSFHERPVYRLTGYGVIRAMLEQLPVKLSLI